ncbi:MAG: transporter substrate-binding protein [Bacilli bacterium]|nr:transporter substrate-binding protein [Bacilli bacterium]
MNGKCKRFLMSSFTVAVGVGVLTACSSTSSSTPGGQSGKPINLTIMADLKSPGTPGDTVIKQIEQKTGYNLTIQWVPDGNYDEKFNAAMATQSLPQAVFVKNTDSYSKLRDPIANGQFWEIGPYLKDFPNLSKLDPTVIQNTEVNGKIYGLYQEVALSRQGIIYRQDWLNKLGLQPPKTIDDLYKMLDAFTNNDPDGDGKKDTVGLTDRNDLVYGSFQTVSSYFGTPDNWGLQNGKLVPMFMSPQYMDTMNFMKKLYTNGVINQDFPVTSKVDQQNMLVNGKAGVYIGSITDVKNLNTKLRQVNPNGQLWVANRIAGPDGKDHGIWSVPGYGTVVLFPKSSIKDVNQLKQVLGFFDDLMKPDIYDLLAFGIEGTHYTLDNGTAKPVSDQALLDREVAPLGTISVGGISTIQGALQPYRTDPADIEANKLVLDNNKDLINDPTAPLDSKTNDQKGAQLKKIITDATYQYMINKLDANGFQAAVSQWQQQGGDQIISEFNDEYQKLKTK